ncbi:Lignostilbene-alpha,beta-dioxygenase isozyme I [Colletotrichum orbiculare MAFF 240422]|uniref:Lignostilbene-alpha,beta-dioxygenase isozyme I n=1 Tax=Colletotrichum orbiculare (strain 104-T / ATCC 96160 / CBS 514.97 / LARS 414 / MAFF 240422) TaxID=1213857 RepID=A0A484FLE4_COLOR|nr:Lignostilbene-alpha,beta-dioxygenase isozyme I [Colletotrichum orbiculare MAFF 240422]
MDMHRLKPLEWQRLPSKVWPGMDKASWPPCDANFDNAVFNRPTRYEGEVCNLEVYRKIRPSISGTFYRIMLEPYHVPFVENDVGPRHFFQEPPFDPRHPGAAEGDGHLIALVNSFDEMSSELVIVDCDDFEEHAAIAKLPVRMRPGFHGNWVDDSDIDGRPVTVPESTVPHRGNGSNGRKGTHG